MASVFTLKKRYPPRRYGGGQAGVMEEVHILNAGLANTGTSYELATVLHRIHNASIVVNGTEAAPYVDEYGNSDGEGQIKAGGTSVTLSWAAAPKDSDFLIKLEGY